MSRTEIYAVRSEDGDMELEAEISNSWSGAMHVWTTLAQRHLDLPGDQSHMIMLREDLMKKVWALASDPRPEWWEKVVLLSTFDRVIIIRGDFDRLIEAFTRWGDAALGGSMTIQCSTFRLIKEHARGFRGICFNQTSVCANPWWVHDESGEDDEGRPFNIDRDSDWWSLFDAAPELRAAADLPPEPPRDQPEAEPEQAGDNQPRRDLLG